MVFTGEVCHLEEHMTKAAMATPSSSYDDCIECFKEFHAKNILLLQISIMLICSMVSRTGGR
jgi:3-deoxy-D-arabino-heptulosonate 7-phosphate (DAHP) synthase class II